MIAPPNSATATPREDERLSGELARRRDRVDEPRRGEGADQGADGDRRKSQRAGQLEVHLNHGERADRSPAGDAEDVGTGEGIPKHPLQHHPTHGESEARDRTHERARPVQVEAHTRQAAPRNVRGNGDDDDHDQDGGHDRREGREAFPHALRVRGTA